ncbi:MAG: cyclopropane-fatty-acyl-phospholipid synthase [Planctomycetaceae bacterium]|nr:MAG: cyclopropane-fatty-acyl-phospholipid synthase [Planctomycetaceae bacterium]
MSWLSMGIEAAERGWLPEWLLRRHIRALCRQRARWAARLDQTAAALYVQQFVAAMDQADIAPESALANQQHYELPTSFFRAILGPRMKYSCCYWPAGVKTLAEAEEAALAETCRHADIRDGQHILDVGCGWGSLTLWLAEHYPRCRILAVSHSRTQRAWIEQQVANRGWQHVEVLTADMNTFHPPPQQFDRIVSIEMFEHMRNYRRLLQRLVAGLKPEGQLLIHIFCHRRLPYRYDTQGAANWMGRHFFTGGIMPHVDLLRHFADVVRLTAHWEWSGLHYQRTAEAWLQQLRQHRHEVVPLLAETYGSVHAHRWFHRWELFFLAVAEMFGLQQGEEWFVGHYLLEAAAAERLASVAATPVAIPAQAR